MEKVFFSHSQDLCKKYFDPTKSYEIQKKNKHCTKGKKFHKRAWNSNITNFPMKTAWYWALILGQNKTNNTTIGCTVLPFSISALRTSKA